MKYRSEKTPPTILRPDLAMTLREETERKMDLLNDCEDLLKREICSKIVRIDGWISLHIRYRSD